MEKLIIIFISKKIHNNLISFIALDFPSILHYVFVYSNIHY